MNGNSIQCFQAALSFQNWMHFLVIVAEKRKGMSVLSYNRKKLMSGFAVSAIGSARFSERHVIEFAGEKLRSIDRIKG